MAAILLTSIEREYYLISKMAKILYCQQPINQTKVTIFTLNEYLHIILN